MAKVPLLLTAAKELLPDLYQIPLGVVNAYLIVDPDGCVLIDTGFPGNDDKILRALADLGRKPADIRHLLLTHTHADHIGNAAALRKACGARTYMHPLDAPITQTGTGFRPMKAAPGLKNTLIASIIHFRIVVLKMKVEPCPIDEVVEDGAKLPIAGGITAIHAPGHCLGQLAFLWERHGGVLLAADSCASSKDGLELSIAYEDIEEGKRSLRKLAEVDFQAACFGHGEPILRDAGRKWRERWAERT